MILDRGRKSVALKVVIYGPEGIGKSTFASMFPRPVFIDTEGSTSHMDVTRTPTPLSWTELTRQVDYFIQNQHLLGTLVIDTADWAEKLCTEQLCSSKGFAGIEDFGYGKGYVYQKEDFGKFLNQLDKLKDRGVHIVLTAHAAMRKFEQPDEMGSYDRWELKLAKQVGPLVKEWADMILFANYKTTVVNVDGQGATKGKNKVTGGRRVMYASHHPCWDAKNRFGLPDEMPFDYAQIAHLILRPIPETEPRDGLRAINASVDSARQPSADLKTDLQPALIPEPTPQEAPPAPIAAPAPAPSAPAPQLPADIPPALAALMVANNIVPFEIQAVVAQKGYYPADMPIAAYDPDFVSAVLVAAWPQVEAAILDNRKTEKTPF